MSEANLVRKSTPNKRSPVRELTILTALEWGATWEAAAKLAGVSRRTVDQWRKDPVFAAQILRARERLRAKQRKATGNCGEDK